MKIKILLSLFITLITVTFLSLLLIHAATLTDTKCEKQQYIVTELGQCIDKNGSDKCRIVLDNKLKIEIHDNALKGDVFIKCYINNKIFYKRQDFE